MLLLFDRRYMFLLIIIKCDDMEERWVCKGTREDICEGCGYKYPPPGYIPTGRIESMKCDLYRTPIINKADLPKEIVPHELYKK